MRVVADEICVLPFAVCVGRRSVGCAPGAVTFLPVFCASIRARSFGSFAKADLWFGFKAMFPLFVHAGTLTTKKIISLGLVICPYFGGLLLTICVLSRSN